MWNADEFVSVLKNHPTGGTLWTRSKRTVRYLRVLVGENYRIAVLTDHARGRNDQAGLFVEFPSGEKKVVIIPDIIQKNPTDEFRSAFNWKNLFGETESQKVEQFVTTPDKTLVPTW